MRTVGLLKNGKVYQQPVKGDAPAKEQKTKKVAKPTESAEQGDAPAKEGE